MTTSPVGGAAQSALSQLYSAGQAQAASAVSVDVPADTGGFAPSTAASGSNSLTGTSSSNLDSQTLQALLELTQQDPSATDPSASQAGQPGQAQGAHHHHHHHGGGGAMPTTEASSAASPAAAGTSTSTANPFADATADAQDADASLESALLAA